MIATDRKSLYGSQPAQNFERFGRSRISLPNRRMRSLHIPSDLPEARQQVREHCPAVAGVYGWIDRVGELLYVGYSSKLQHRLLTYFSSSDQGLKENRIASRSARLVWEEVGHEFAAQLCELELIRRFHPRMNRQGRTIRIAMAYLTIADGDAGRVRISDTTPPDNACCWGPLPMNRRLTEAVRHVNQTFALTDSERGVPLSYDKPGLSDIATSSEQTSEQPNHQALQVQSFLDGEASNVIDHFKIRMEKCKVAGEYHSAATFRDRWQALQHIQRELQLLRNPIVHEIVYAPEIDRRRYWFIIRHGMVVWAGRRPQRRQQAKAALQQLEAPADAPYGVQSDRTMLRIVNNWFCSNPNELKDTLSISSAQHHCQSILES